MKAQPKSEQQQPSADIFERTTTGFPEIDQIRDLITRASILDRGILCPSDRIICSLSYIMALHEFDELENLVRATIKHGIKPEAITEVLLQVCLYNGFYSLNGAISKLRETFKTCGLVLKIDANPLPFENATVLNEQAKDLQALIHGPRSNIDHADPRDIYTHDLYSVATTYGYGLIWSRPGLRLKQRFLVALSSFVALNLPDSYFSKFAQSAFAHGVSKEEIIEVVVQGAPYAGFPKGLAKLMQLKHIFSESTPEEKLNPET